MTKAEQLAADHLEDAIAEGPQIQCSECGRVYPLADADIQKDGDCPSDDCPTNNEHPKKGTLTLCGECGYALNLHGQPKLHLPCSVT